MIEWSEDIITGHLADDNIPQAYRNVQLMLDRFVAVNHDTAERAYSLHLEDNGFDTGRLKQQMLDILRNNPPLSSVPARYKQGDEHYLWYSDFYDDVPKAVFKH